jgi:hypothetical protein
LWLFAVCILPGTTLLVVTFTRPSTPRRHQHEWRPYLPPGGTVRLLDARHRPLTRLLPGQIARIDCLPTTDMDRCRVPDPDCELAPEGIIPEDEGPRLLDLEDGGAGGEFGQVMEDGRFQALPPERRPYATHYRASGRRWGTFAFWARFDDRGVARFPSGHVAPTYDDPTEESRMVWITIGPELEAEGLT